jgi:hypothetical protein
MPGRLRDAHISLDGGTTSHGPPAHRLPDLFAFSASITRALSMATSG